MDAILSTVTDAALVVVFGLVTLVTTYPDQIFWICTVLFVLVISRNNKTLRRIQDWYLWFPFQRAIHRLYVPKRRRIMRGLMCRVKKSVVADIIDKALRDAIETRHITYHDYRELCVKVGQALEISDLLPRGKRHKEAIRRIVEKNCKEMRESLAKVGNIPEPQKSVSTLTYLRNRRTAA